MERRWLSIHQGGRLQQMDENVLVESRDFRGETSEGRRNCIEFDLLDFGTGVQV